MSRNVKLKTYRRPSLWPRLLLITGIVLIIAAITGVVVVRRSYYQNLKPVSTADKAVLVTIPLGSTVKEIGTLLQKSGVIRASWAFEWYVRNNNLRDDIQAGTYYLRPNQTIDEIASALTQGKVATDLITFPPGRRIDELRQVLLNSGFKESDVDDALNPANYVNHPALVDKPRDASLEGYLYPESFQKTAETKASTIVEASLDEMQANLTPQLRASIVKQGLTVHEGVVLASIIEKEVSNPDDKRTVAQVFLKRLREGKALESDATAIYGAVLDGQEPSIFYDSGYNTYKHPGLTPSPISNVSATSLAAVANPTATDYLFFVSGDDGKTYFSRTLAEHEQNITDHCTKLCGN